MDKGLLYFLCLISGLLFGLVVRRKARPLLAERWQALYLAFPAILVSVLPFILYQYKPAWIWSQDRSLLMSLILLRALCWGLLLGLNLLPSRWITGQPDRGLTLVQKLCLLPVLLGLTGETAVLLLNSGFWSLPATVLTGSAGPAFAAGVRNQAFVFLQVIDDNTRLPWLGQIWFCPLLRIWHLATLPTISPAEALTAVGLFSVGFSQFFAPDLPNPRHGWQRK